MQLLQFRRLAGRCDLAIVNQVFSRQDLTRDTVSASVPNALVETPHEWLTSQVAKRIVDGFVPQRPHDGCRLGAVSLDALVGAPIGGAGISASYETQ